MSDGTNIEWTDATWNVVNGCSVTSPGCTHCYAMKLAGTRLRHHPSRAGLTVDTKAGPVWTGEVRFQESVLLDPLRWTRPRRIFACAHGDLFHENVPDAWIDRVIAVMALAPQHQFQVLTKRSARMRAHMSAFEDRPEAFGEALASVVRAAGFGLQKGLDTIDAMQWPLPNVWLGVSIEDQARADERIPDLLGTPAAVRWLSCEPLLGPVDLSGVSDDSTALDPECWGDCACDSLYGYDAGCRRNGGDGCLKRKIDWVVIGGESGSAARPMHPAWAKSLRDQCSAAGVPMLFKQWGAWAPVSDIPDTGVYYKPAPARDPEATRACKVNTCVLHANGGRFDGAARYGRGAFEQGSGAMTMMAIGKHRAGRLLDGLQHDGMPTPPTATETPA